ncbi:MAG TPA: aminoglycoside phosphotransferase family protein [Myxococcota bacterium]|nr:aminoglycoside phosphotransferase family protein [Myxococcota bacterium]
MQGELEEIHAWLARAAPRLASEPIAERARSDEKTVWSIGATHIARRANAEWVRPLFLREHRLLRHLDGRVSLDIPMLVISTPDGGLDLFRKAPGEPVGHEWWPRRDPASQRRIAGQLGRFLAELHALVPAGAASAMGFERSFWSFSASWVEERLRGRLESPAQRSLLEDLLRAAPRIHAEGLPPALLHDDFSHHNLGFSDDGEHAVGVFDFTEARIGDPHRDLRYAYTFEPFAETMIQAYERTRGIRLDRNRLRAWHAWSALAYLAWELHEGDPRRLPMRWGWVDHVAAWDRNFLDVA